MDETQATEAAERVLRYLLDGTEGYTRGQALDFVASEITAACGVRVVSKTCHPEGYYADQANGSGWMLSCGHAAAGDDCPNYCPRCGAAVLNC